ncbi:MAG: ankyrin repeat domain-containing protein, partial [Myxococcales bacterium]|nr:ankyrin repeat domain-containing protein [Myxococcales bacterium]
MSVHDDALADLYQAAKQGKWALLSQLFDELPRLAAKAARYVKPSSGWSFLHQAAYFGHEGAARSLIGAGAEPASRSHAGETPSDVAAERGHDALATMLRRAMSTGEAS